MSSIAKTTKSYSYRSTGGGNADVQIEYSADLSALSRLEDKIRLLQEDLETEREFRQRIEREKADLSVQVIQLQERLEEAEGGAETQFEINKKRDTELAKLRKLLEDVHLESEETAHLLRKKHQEIVVDFQDQIDQLTKAKQRAEKERARFQQEVYDLLAQIEAATKDKLISQKHVEKLEVQIHELNIRIEELNRTVIDITSIKTRISQENIELTKEVQDLKVNIENVNYLKSQLAGQLEDARRRLEDDERRRSLLETSLHQVEVELESVRVQLEEEAEARLDLERQLVKATGEVQTWRSKYEAEAAARAEEIEELRRKYNSRIQEQEEHIESLVVKLNNLEKQKSRLQSEVEILIIDLEKANNTARELQKRVEQLEKINIELKSRLDETVNLYEQAQRDLRNKQTEIQRLTHELEKTREQKDVLARENKKLSDDLHDAKNQIAEMNRRLHEMEIELRRLENEREELSAAYKEAEAGRKAEEQRAQRLAAEMAQYRHEMERRLQEKDEEIEAISAEAKEISGGAADEAISNMNCDIKLAAKAEKRAKENLQNYRLSRFGSLSLSSKAIGRLAKEENKESRIEKLEKYIQSRSSECTSFKLRLTPIMKENGNGIVKTDGEILNEISRELSKKANSAAKEAQQFNTFYSKVPLGIFQNRALEKQTSIEIEQLTARLVEAETKLKTEITRIKKKFQIQITELELSLDVANKNNIELQKTIKKQSLQLTELQAHYDEIQRQLAVTMDQYGIAQRRVQSLTAELEEIRGNLDAAIRAKRNAEQSYEEAVSRVNELTTINVNLASAKSKIEQELAQLANDYDEATKELRVSDERYQRVQVELKHTVEILHEEQERIVKIEAIKKSLEIEVKNLSVRLEEVEANAIVGGKRIISKLEARIRDIEMELDEEKRRHAETIKILRKKERQVKELAIQNEEDQKNITLLQDSLEKINQKVNIYKRQLQEQEGMSQQNVTRVRRFQRELEAAEDRADTAESNLSLIRAKHRTFVTTSTVPGSQVYLVQERHTTSQESF